MAVAAQPLRHLLEACRAVLDTCGTGSARQSLELQAQISRRLERLRYKDRHKAVREHAHTRQLRIP